MIGGKENRVRRVKGLKDQVYDVEEVDNIDAKLTVLKLFVEVGNWIIIFITAEEIIGRVDDYRQVVILIYQASIQNVLN